MNDEYQKAAGLLKLFYVIPVVVVIGLVGVTLFLVLGQNKQNSGQVESTSTLESAVGIGDPKEIIPDSSSNLPTQTFETAEQPGAIPTSVQPVEESTQTQPEFSQPTMLVDDSMMVISPQLVDDYFINPGIGWIYKWGTTDQSNPETSLVYSSRIDISWKELNPSEGQYNWNPLDFQLEIAKDQGKQFSFRVYTMVGEGFGGHQVPQWVLDKGAVILSSGEPDYSNCAYQEEWANFVSALITRYDGNPHVAFIDVSGYGNFNEWNWSDAQTEWDDIWTDSYSSGIINSGGFTSLDGMARRRLADMFIGGSNSVHKCRNQDASVSTVDYDYAGFQNTQLVMPFAGVVQSAQYVFSKNNAVGFRYDCLGRSDGIELLERIENEIDEVWKNAPVIFETCSPNRFSIGTAYYMVETYHASVIHNVNIDNIPKEDIYGLLDGIGYQYYLSRVVYPAEVTAGGEMQIEMVWENIGNAPSYPGMGQTFDLIVYLVDAETGITIDIHFDVDISSWLPADEFGGTPPQNAVSANVSLPSGVPGGVYETKVAIIDLRTGLPIQLPLSGRDDEGRYSLSMIKIVD